MDISSRKAKGLHPSALNPPSIGDGALAAARRRAFVRYLKDGPHPQLRVLHGGGAVENIHVTIIIPTVDGVRGGNLNRLLAQLDQQSFQQFEVMIVQGDSRQGRAINTAAAMARGGILVTMDDDTSLGPTDLLEKIVNAFYSDESVGIVGVSNLESKDAPWIVRRAMRELPRRTSPLVDFVVDSDMAEHPCLAIRRDIFYRVGGEHERIPRGLDPYLRREVRRLGYRVVVIPSVWIHHLLPSTLRGIVRQYFRHGVGAAYVQKFFPEFVIEQAERHQQRLSEGTSLPRRVLRYAKRITGALLSGKWIHLATLFSYAAGYVWGILTLRENSL